MTNNTINVPRELLEVIEQTWRIHYRGGPVTTDIAADAIEKGLGQLRALLSAPSPAGVDGLEVVALWYADDDLGRAVDYVKIADGEGLCRLSDAQAIIDGLRGENEALQNRRLDADAQVANTRFGVGIKERTVIDAAKRYAEYMAQPEQEADRIAKGAEFLAALQAPAQVIALGNERDQQAKRIGELEGLLREAAEEIRDLSVAADKMYGGRTLLGLRDDSDSSVEFADRIDAALSAGKEVK